MPVLVVTDSWFGNNGLLKPLRQTLGERAHVLTRLRVNNTLYALPPAAEGRKGRPRKYGARLGSASDLAAGYQARAKSYVVSLYGKCREVLAHDRVLMLKTLRCPVRVVWVYRRTQWIALVTTDLGLTVEQIIEFYGARWKIESGFREIKQEIGSSQSQTRNAYAVTNCYVARPLTRFIASSLTMKPPIGVPFRAHPYRKPERNTPRENRDQFKEQSGTCQARPIQRYPSHRLKAGVARSDRSRCWEGLAEDEGMDFTETLAPARLM